MLKKLSLFLSVCLMATAMLTPVSNTAAADESNMSLSAVGGVTNSYDEETTLFMGLSGTGNSIIFNSKDKVSASPQNGTFKRLGKTVEYIKGVGENGTAGLKVKTIDTANASEPTALKIYDPSTVIEGPAGWFLPENRTAYRITLRYKLDSKISQDIHFGLRGVSAAGDMGNVDGSNSTVLSQFYTLSADTAATDGWQTITADHVTVLGDYIALAITLHTDGSAISDPGLYIDSITVEPVKVTSVTNSYDEETTLFMGLSGTGNSIIFNSKDKVSASPQNGTFKRLGKTVEYIKGVGENGTAGLKVKTIDTANASEPTALKIYDPSTVIEGPAGWFLPENRTAYRITLRYKLDSKISQDIHFGLRGVSAAGDMGNVDGSNSTVLSQFYTLSADTAATDGWQTITADHVTVLGDYIALAITLHTDDSDISDPGLYIDSVTVEPVKVDGTVNNYDDDGVYYQQFDNYGYFNRTYDKAGKNNIDAALTFPHFANGTFTENGGVNGSRAFGFTSASQSKNDYPVAVRVYDSGSAGKQLFIPQKNTTYRIKLKYNLPEHLNWADLYLSVNGMTAQSGAFGRGDELAKVVQIWRDSEIATGQWLEATATFTTGDTDYEGLGLFFATLNNATVNVKLWIDDIEITKVTYPYGDVNMDEKVDIRDLVRLKKISVGEAPETANANMDDDPAINATDISILRKLLLGISDEITVNSQTGISEGTGDSKSPVRSLWKALGMVNDGGTIHIEGVYSVSEADVIAGGKRVTVTGGALDFTKIDSVKLGGAFTFRDINIRWQDGCEVFACGNAVTIAESVNITGVPAALYGGAAGGTIEETNLRVLAGNYKVIYGGSGGGIITGDTNLYIGGSANSNAIETSHNTDYIIFGGSNSGTVMGSTHLTLAGGKANYSYGGGANSSSSVRGTCFTELCGMRLMSVYGGSRSGGEVSATDIVMTSGWCEQIFGGSEHSPIIGKTEINLTGGTVVRRIYGGCYDSNSANFVTGTTTVRLGGSVNYTGNYVGWGENTICAGSRIGNRAEEVSSLYIETQELYDSLKEKIGRYTGYGCDYLYIAGIKQ